MKAVDIALKASPDFNAVWAGDEIQRLGGSDIALVVLAFGGRFTPVIREVEGMTITNIAAERTSLKARATSGKLKKLNQKGSARDAVAVLDMSRTDALKYNAGGRVNSRLVSLRSDRPVICFELRAHEAFRRCQSDKP